MATPQFELYTHVGGPNGWKVAFVLKALGLTYTSHYLDFSKNEQKGAAYTKLNPNGRIPTIVDHGNDDFVLWESNAIMIYLVETYDKEGRLSVRSPKGKALLQQWLYFQASGQGPYFGQAVHFLHFAPEKLPYAIQRYQAEIVRVYNVLDSVLSRTPFLLGDKATIADLSFVTWNNYALAALLPEDKKKEDFIHVAAWQAKLVELPYVKEVLLEHAAVDDH